MPNTIHLPDAPALVGLSFRSIVGPEDADALCAIHQGRKEHDQIDPLSTSEGLPRREQVVGILANAVDAGQQDDWLIAQVEGQVVGYSRVACWPEADGTWVYLSLGWVLPEWRGQGIGTAMLHWAEERIRHRAAVEHPNEKCEFAANASSTEKEATELLLHEGYYVAYTVLEMALDASALVPVYPLPAGIEVRPALIEHYALIVASVQGAYKNEYEGGRFAEVADSADLVDTLSDPRYDPTLWQVAWEGDQVAGQVMPVIENGRAEIFEVSVLLPWRRRGLARALLTRALHNVRAREIDVIRLRTIASFPTRAQDLYRSVGFRLMKEFPRYRKPLG